MRQDPIARRIGGRSLILAAALSACLDTYGPDPAVEPDPDSGSGPSPTTSTTHAPTTGAPSTGETTSEAGTQTTDDLDISSTSVTTSDDVACGPVVEDRCAGLVRPRSDRLQLDLDALDQAEVALLANDIVPDAYEVALVPEPAPQGDAPIGDDGTLVYTAPETGFGCDAFRYSVESGPCSASASVVASLSRQAARLDTLVLQGHVAVLVDWWYEPLGSEFGYAAASADFDGDGIDNAVVVGRYLTSNNTNRTYFIDTAAALDDPGEINLIESCEQGACWHLSQPWDFPWAAVAHGDSDGDGLDDIIGGVPVDTNAKGRVTILYGNTATHADQTDLEYAAEYPTKTFTSIAGSADMLGSLVYAGADVDRDGLADIVAASGNTPRAYVIFGRDDRYADVPESLVSQLVSFGHARQISLPAGQVFSSLHSAGDLDRDGHDDLLLGVAGAIDTPGAVYVVFGRSGADRAKAVNLGLPPQGNFTTLTGEQPGDRFGASVVGGGDLNGDSFPDLVVGAPGLDGDLGAVYVVFGRADAVTVLAPLPELLAADPPGAIRIHTGETARLGTSLAMGDFNGDGFDDLAIGAPAWTPAMALSTPGAAFLLHGAPTLLGGAVEAWTGQDGLRLDGDKNHGYSQQLPRALTLDGDHDGDGFADLLLTLTPSDELHNRTWIVPGRCTNGRVSQVGTPEPEVLSGDAALDDVIVAGRGDDTLTDIGDQDVALTGAGDDTIEIHTIAFQRIDGGPGHDTLALRGCGLTLDLATKVPLALREVETIDLGAHNTLRIDNAALARISSTTNLLVVRGAAGSVVDTAELDGEVMMTVDDHVDIVVSGTPLLLRVHAPVETN